MQIILVHMKCFAQGLVLLQVQGNLEIVTGVFGPGTSWVFAPYQLFRMKGY